VRTYHYPTHEPTVKHGKTSYSPTQKPSKEAEEYTYDDQIYYGETGYEASGKSSDKSSDKSSKKSKSSKKNSDKSSSKSSSKKSSKKSSGKDKKA